MKMKLHHWKVIALGLMVFDIIAITLSWFFGLFLRFDFIYSNIPQQYLQAYARFLPWYLVGTVVFFWFMRMYRGIWRFAGFHELLRYGGTSLIASLAHIICISIFCTRMPFSYYVIGLTVQTILVVGCRFSYRFYNEVMRKNPLPEESSPEHRVMIIGAGAAGRNVVRELSQTTEIDYKPCCIIDDNSNKWGRFIEGVPVVGGRESIQENAKKYGVDQIYFCIPSASVQVRKDILNICKETGCKLKSLPGLYQLASEEVLVSRLKPVAIEDLLGREPIRVEMDEIFQQIRGKTILVTGGGGSIGSELCRQIAGHEPGRLIIFDIYENTTYNPVFDSWYS
ncbi:MAG: polysaccharide biosynthesis protein [Clostridiales bacterium]|nr:polysaccharide biosynthesis protein [Clostridiales bacterium]